MQFETLSDAPAATARGDFLDIPTGGRARSVATTGNLAGPSRPLRAGVIVAACSR